MKIIIIFYYIRTKLFDRLMRNKYLYEFIRNLNIKSYHRWLIKNSPYYKNKKHSSFNRIEKGNKNFINNNFDQINTHSLKFKDCMELALKAEQNRNFNSSLNGITIGLSSGTSGNRGLFIAEKSERSKWAGVMLAKVLPGSLFSNYKICLFLRANSNLYESVGSKNIKFKFFDLLDPIENNISKLQYFNPNVLVAPASMLKIIAKEIKNGKLSIFPKKIVSVAEVLDPLDEIFMEKVFSQKIHQIYQCTEGFIGATCEYGKVHLNEDFLYIEKEYIDKDRRRFIPIITDTLRTSCPIVRYRLNDILIESNNTCKCGRRTLTLDKIEGREDDIFYFHSEESNKKIPVFPDYLRRKIITASNDIEEYHIRQLSINKIEIQLKPSGNAEINEIVLKNIYSLIDSLNLKKPEINIVKYKESQGHKKMKRVERCFPMQGTTLE